MDEYHLRNNDTNDILVCDNINVQTERCPGTVFTSVYAGGEERHLCITCHEFRPLSELCMPAAAVQYQRNLREEAMVAWRTSRKPRDRIDSALATVVPHAPDTLVLPSRRRTRTCSCGFALALDTYVCDECGLVLDVPLEQSDTMRTVFFTAGSAVVHTSMNKKVHTQSLSTPDVPEVAEAEAKEEVVAKKQKPKKRVKPDEPPKPKKKRKPCVHGDTITIDSALQIQEELRRHPAWPDDVKQRVRATATTMWQQYKTITTERMSVAPADQVRQVVYLAVLQSGTFMIHADFLHPLTAVRPLTAVERAVQTAHPTTFRPAVWFPLLTARPRPTKKKDRKRVVDDDEGVLVQQLGAVRKRFLGSDDATVQLYGSALCQREAAVQLGLQLLTRSIDLVLNKASDKVIRCAPRFWSVAYTLFMNSHEAFYDADTVHKRRKLKSRNRQRVEFLYAVFMYAVLSAVKHAIRICNPFAVDTPDKTHQLGVMEPLLSAFNAPFEGIKYREKIVSNKFDTHTFYTNWANDNHKTVHSTT